MNFDIQICSFASNQKFQNHFFNSVKFKVQNSFSFINANRFFYFRQTKKGGWKFALLSNNRLPNTRRIKESETTLFLKLGILTITKPVLLSCAHFFVMKQTAKGRSRAIKSTRSFKEKKKKKRSEPSRSRWRDGCWLCDRIRKLFSKLYPFFFHVSSPSKWLRSKAANVRSRSWSRSGTIFENKLMTQGVPFILIASGVKNDSWRSVAVIGPRWQTTEQV